MSDITPTTFPKDISNPILRGLPVHLKDPANFEKVQRALLETLGGTHSHSELQTWGTCVPCQRKLRDHGLMMKKLGFKSPAQYRMWVRVHRKIQEHEKVRLPKYNTKI